MKVTYRLDELSLADGNEYSVTFEKNHYGVLSITNKQTRLTNPVPVHFHGGKWSRADNLPMKPAVVLVMDYYYKKWELEDDMALIGVESAEAKRQRIGRDIKSVMAAEVGLDDQRQTNAFVGGAWAKPAQR